MSAVLLTGTSLVFDYTVQSTDGSADMKVTGINQSGGTITDDAGNPVSSALAFESKLKVNVFTWAQAADGNFSDGS